jgi:hypothetical protein
LTFRELRSPSVAPTTNLDAAVNAIGVNYVAQWQAASKQFADPVRTKIMEKFSLIEAQQRLLSPLERADAETRQIDTMGSPADLFATARLPETLSEIERGILQTNEIKVAVDREARLNPCELSSANVKSWKRSCARSQIRLMF